MHLLYERDFLIIAISDWQLHWCGGKALKSHLEIQIREWECCVKANGLSSCRSDCCISLVLNFYLFIIFHNCSSSCSDAAAAAAARRVCVERSVAL